MLAIMGLFCICFFTFVGTFLDFVHGSPNYSKWKIYNYFLCRNVVLYILCKSRGLGPWNLSNPAIIYWSACSKSGKLTMIYLCFACIYFASNVFWNSSDSVVFCCFFHVTTFYFIFFCIFLIEADCS